LEFKQLVKTEVLWGKEVSKTSSAHSH